MDLDFLIKRDVPASFAHHFNINVLDLHPLWKRTVTTRQFYLSESDETYWVHYISFKPYNEILTAFGVGKNRKKAKNSACYQLYWKFLHTHPAFLLPATIIGFPNIRDGCVCKNTFTTEDAKYLVGHILEKNYLLVCEGCHRGIADWTCFLDHPTEACFIERPVRKN
uniref:Uncharacterized protein n=1 Tax=Tetranychus urticae TaxID=32264 RepID=T1L537_TETUR